VSAAERATQTVVITAKPRFEQQEHFISLIISNTNHSFDIAWGMQPDMQFEVDPIVWTKERGN